MEQRQKIPIVQRHAPWVLAMAMVVGVAMPDVRASERDDTYRVAVYLLRNSLRPVRDGSHINMILALRQLHDPELEPLFSAMIQSQDPVMKVHGVLGLAECANPRQIDLMRIAAVQSESLQEALLATAMDSELLTDDQAIQVINWPGLSLGAKIVVAGMLIEHGKFNHPELLEEASRSENPQATSLANLYRVHRGEADQSVLDKINIPNPAMRDRVRSNLLLVAMRHKIRAAGPWAMRIATDPSTDQQLALLAIKVGIRFGVPGAHEHWRERFLSTGDLAAQLRLALVAFREAVHADPVLFEPLVQSEVPLLRQLGLAGRAIASGQGTMDAVVALAGMNPPNPRVNEWVLRYAELDAAPADAQGIFLALILAYEESEDRYRAQLLEGAMSATQSLFELHPDAAIQLLRPVLASPNTHPQLVRGILMGLIRSREPNAHEVLRGVPMTTDLTARNLILLLRGKHGDALTAEELNELGIMVRGGRMDLTMLRIQAAWTWLKRTGQTGRALAEVVTR